MPFVTGKDTCHCAGITYSVAKETNSFRSECTLNKLYVDVMVSFYEPSQSVHTRTHRIYTADYPSSPLFADI